MFAWIVSRPTILVLTVALAGLSGCGSGEEAPPPTSDSVTTEPLDIELPKPEENRGPGTSPDVQPADEIKTTP